MEGKNTKDNYTCFISSGIEGKKGKAWDASCEKSRSRIEDESCFIEYDVVLRLQHHIETRLGKRIVHLLKDSPRKEEP
jgi:hypothetical protein